MSNTEFYVDGAGQHRFRVKAGNGEIIASSEGYTTKQSAQAGLEVLRQVLLPDAQAAAWAEGAAAGWKPDSLGIKIHRSQIANPYLDCTCGYEEIYVNHGQDLVRIERIQDESCPTHSWTVEGAMSDREKLERIVRRRGGHTKATAGDILAVGWRSPDEMARIKAEVWDEAVDETAKQGTIQVPDNPYHYRPEGGK